jgi:aryl-alcohol dehydrogenase-like predicted oxidoreductase
MEMRAIGSIPVPLSGIGCNNFGRRIDETRSREVIDAAFEVGATLFDTADLYGDTASEEFLGRALKGRRDEAVIASKFGMRTPPDGMTGGDPRWVRKACDESLRRLATDRIDVYLLHEPDDQTPIEDTLSTMSGLIDAGKVLEIGCSNFSAKQLDEAQDAATELKVRRFVTVQNEYSLLAREARDEVLPACGRLGISFMPYFPLASGMLTGKYRKGEPLPAGSRMAGPGGWDEFLTDERFELGERLAGFADRHGHTLLELALSWLASQPPVATVIAGATSSEQVRANAAAVEAWTMSDEELAELDELFPERTR